MKGYRCPGCGKMIGLIYSNKRPGDQLGEYFCPHSRQIQPVQLPIKRDTPKPPPAQQFTVVLRKPIMPEEPV